MQELRSEDGRDARVALRAYFFRRAGGFRALDGFEKNFVSGLSIREPTERLNVTGRLAGLCGSGSFF